MNITKGNVWMITLVVLITAFIVFVTWESPKKSAQASGFTDGFRSQYLDQCQSKVKDARAVLSQAQVEEYCQCNLSYIENNQTADEYTQADTDYKSTGNPPKVWQDASASCSPEAL